MEGKHVQRHSGRVSRRDQKKAGGENARRKMIHRDVGATEILAERTQHCVLIARATRNH